MFKLITVNTGETSSDETEKILIHIRRVFKQYLPNTILIIIPEHIRNQIIGITEIYGENEDTGKSLFLVQVGCGDDSDEQVATKLENIKNLFMKEYNTNFEEDSTKEKEDFPIVFAETREEPCQVYNNKFGCIWVEEY